MMITLLLVVAEFTGARGLAVGVMASYIASLDVCGLREMHAMARHVLAFEYEGTWQQGKKKHKVHVVFLSSSPTTTSNQTLCHYITIPFNKPASSMA